MATDYIPTVTSDDRQRAGITDRPVSCTTLKDLFEKTTLQNIFNFEETSDSGIISARTTDPINKTFQLLIDNGILSVPVYDQKSRKFTKFIDVVDFVSFIHKYYTKDNHDDFVQNIKSTGELSDLSTRNPFYPVEKNLPLKSVLDVIANHHIHRIPVVESQDIENIISQSDMLRFLHKNVDLIEDADKTIEELQIGFKEVASIKEDALAIEGFALIDEKKVSGVAICQENKVVGNLSASDLKRIGFNASNIARLWQTAMEFVKGDNDSVPVPICVTPSDTLAQVITTLYTSRKHRVYLVPSQENKSLLGVISQVDILEYIAKVLK